MRLLTRNALVLLAVTIVVFFLGGFVFYDQLNQIMDEEAIEALLVRKELVEEYIQSENELPGHVFFEDEIQFDSTASIVSQSIANLNIFIEEEDDSIPFKQLRFGVVIEEQPYQCTIRKSLFESDDIIETILFSLLIIALLLILFFVGINYLFSKMMWRPFFRIMKGLNEYDVDKHQVLKATKSGTSEFDTMAATIESMTLKISNDFNSLKSFTENASHELQTPLATIKNKIELMLQTEDLPPAQVQQIVEINRQVSRLAKINKSLLLLSKIENKQYLGKNEINIAAVVNEKINQYQDLIAMKGITCKLSINISLVYIHADLAEVLISNLLMNAIKYCPEHGELSVTCDQNNLEIANSGSQLISDADQIFMRFYKENTNEDSTGLGLAIVKQIALANGHEVKYSYQNNMHTFRYTFTPSSQSLQLQ
jgi:signal transduction histidine kinase